MSGGTGRKIAVVLAVGALALAGCGGSSKSSGSSGSAGNANDDAQSVNKAVQAYKAATSGVQTNSTDPASWDKLSQGAKQAADSINGLTAPSELQSAQQALVTSLTDLSDAAGRVASDLRNNDTGAAQTDLAKAAAANQAYEAAGAAWANAAKSAAGG